jgi:hypothetical protein
MDRILPTFHGNDLREVLAEAREAVLKAGQHRYSQRGEVTSAAGVQLVWEQPADRLETYWGWDREATRAYYDLFVEERSENLPERLALPGEMVFPYTYAARSRFWDGGWGAVLAVLNATRAAGAGIHSLLGREGSFRSYLREAGEQVHVQTLLAVWDWIGGSQMAWFLEAPERAGGLIQRARIDQLERVIREVEQNPASRRAVTASFTYPNLDQRFARLQSLPPYQLFQLLPGEPGGPLHSFHVHRSLDASDGVQLDFYHDYCWLETACRRLERPLGTVTIVAGDFHVYRERAKAVPGGQRGMLDWLLRVTDGYPAGQGRAQALLEEEWYAAQTKSVFERLGG